MCGIVIGTKRPRAHSTPRSALSALPTSRRGAYGEQHPVPDGRPAPGRGAGIRTCPADFRVGVRSRRHFSASLGSCLDHGLSPYVAFPFVHSSGTTTCRGHRTSEEQRRCVPTQHHRCLTGVRRGPCTPGQASPPHMPRGQADTSGQLSESSSRLRRTRALTLSFLPGFLCQFSL